MRTMLQRAEPSAAGIARPADPHSPASGWRGTWTPARARLWLIAAAFAAYLPLVGVPLRGWLDFSAFYAAGSLVFTPGVVSISAIVAFEQAHHLPITPFVYPPGLALLYAPFAALPYGVAAALHAGLMLAFLVGAVAWIAPWLGLSRRWAVLGALAWGPAAAGVASGQNSSLALGLVAVVAVSLARQRHLVAGLAAGLLAYKPQLGLPVAGLFALTGRRVALLGFGLMIALHYVAGVAATGGDVFWPGPWLRTLTAYTGPDFAANGWQAISLPALGTRLELMTGVGGLAAVGYVFGGIIVLACLPALRRLPAIESVALACALGLVVSPHAWVYDATLLLPAVGVFAARAMRRGWPWQDRWLLATAFIIGLTWPLGGFVGFTLVPLLVVAAPILLVRPLRFGMDAPAQSAVAPRGSLPLGQ